MQSSIEEARNLIGVLEAHIAKEEERAPEADKTETPRCKEWWLAYYKLNGLHGTYATKEKCRVAIGGMDGLFKAVRVIEPLSYDVLKEIMVEAVYGDTLSPSQASFAIVCCMQCIKRLGMTEHFPE